MDFSSIWTYKWSRHSQGWTSRAWQPIPVTSGRAESPRHFNIHFLIVMQRAKASELSFQNCRNDCQKQLHIPRDVNPYGSIRIPRVATVEWNQFWLRNAQFIFPFSVWHGWQCRFDGQHPLHSCTLFSLNFIALRHWVESCWVGVRDANFGMVELDSRAHSPVADWGAQLSMTRFIHFLKQVQPAWCAQNAHHNFCQNMKSHVLGVLGFRKIQGFAGSKAFLCRQKTPTQNKQITQIDGGPFANNNKYMAAWKHVRDAHPSITVSAPPEEQHLPQISSVSSSCSFILFDSCSSLQAVAVAVMMWILWRGGEIEHKEWVWGAGRVRNG